MNFPKWALCLAFFAVGCTDKSPPKVESYYQPVKTRETGCVIEWNILPATLATCFLVNKEKGIFVTAKHFTDDLEGLLTDEVKMFFNGKVYSSFVLGTAFLYDAVLLKLEEPFDFSDFPEPYRISKKPVSVGDKVFVRGFHPHPYLFSKEKALAGMPDVIVSIIEGYYGLTLHDEARRMEVVFGDLEAEVTELGYRAPIKRGSGRISRLDAIRDAVNAYTVVKTKTNHKISFAGLSGGAVVNDKEELVGIVTAEVPMRLEYDPDGKYIMHGGMKIKGVRDIIIVTPIETIKDLLMRAGAWR